MDQKLMNLIVDEGIVATAVTLSRKLDILADEANKLMVEFYEKHKSSGDIWATYAVCGSRDKYDSSVRSTVVCREEDLSRTKKQFKVVHNVKLFSIQTVKAKHLHSLLANDRLEDLQFFRSDSERNVMRSEAMKRCVEVLNKELQTSPSDVCIAMNQLLEINEKQKSSLKSCESKKEIRSAPQQPKVNNLFKKACERQKTPKNSPKKEVRKSPWKEDEPNSGHQSDESDLPVKLLQNSDHPEIGKVDDVLIPQAVSQPVVKQNSSNKFPTSSVPKAKKLNQDIFDDEDCSPEKSSEVEEKPMIKISSKGKRSQSAPRNVEKSAAPLASETTRSTDEAPSKKRKMVKSIETFKDEDGFLVTKEVAHMVESDEPEEEQMKPLRPANAGKSAPTVHSKKKNGGVGSQKISDFFMKK